MPCPASIHIADVNGWVILALMLPGLLVLIGLVAGFVLRRPKRGERAMPAPGYYHVMGIDRATGAKRESTFHAQSSQSARGRAELEGIVVTGIRQVNESLRER